MLIIGPLVLAATIYVARGFAIFERLRLRTFQGRQATHAHTISRPQSLLDVGWSLLGLVTGTLAACISITWWAAVCHANFAWLLRTNHARPRP